MATKNTKMGFEGVIYYGVAGTEASTQITNRTDITKDTETKTAPTTVAGIGSAPPVTTERVVEVGQKIEWTMLNKADDTSLEALRVAAAAGNPVAIRTKDYAAGKGFNGDCVLSESTGKPMGGEQTIKFTATPTDEGGRTPSLYS